MTRTLILLCRLHLLADLKGLPGVYDINNSARSRGLEVLEEDAGMTTVCVGGVNTFCRKVVELLEVGVPGRRQVEISTVTWRMDGGESSHDDLLLVRVLERLAPPDRVLALRADLRAAAQARDVAAHDWRDAAV